MTTNIWTEKKVHITKNGTRKTLCGASSNETPLTVTAYNYVPPGVTCERCIKCFLRQLKESK